jgi:hypothetical protein
MSMALAVSSKEPVVATINKTESNFIGATLYRLVCARQL